MRITLCLAYLATWANAFSLPCAHAPSLRKTQRASSAVMQTLPPKASELMNLLNGKQEQISFQLTMAVIDELYDVREVPFSCGDTVSEAGQNMGSAKIFSFGKDAELEASTTLNLFGDYYRKDVLENPDGTDHANIRGFIAGGWDAVKFPEGLALTSKGANDYTAFGPQLGQEYKAKQ